MPSRRANAAVLERLLLLVMLSAESGLEGAIDTTSAIGRSFELSKSAGIPIIFRSMLSMSLFGTNLKLLREEALLAGR